MLAGLFSLEDDRNEMGLIVFDAPLDFCYGNQAICIKVFVISFHFNVFVSLGCLPFLSQFIF